MLWDMAAFLYICHYHISYDGFRWTVVMDDPFVSLVQIG